MPAMLYYPRINAPVPVLYQALLYWDELATVVPLGYERDLDDQMRRVADAGLYRPIEARRVYQPWTLDEVGPELEHALRSLPVDDLIPPNRGTTDEANTRMYTSKLHREVLDELLRRRLAYITPGSDPETLTASPALLMILVSITARRVSADTNARLGCTGPEALRPYTDIDISFHLGNDPIPSRDAIECWQVEIGGLLPVPHTEVMMSDVIAFRNRYADERQRLMRELDRFLHELQHSHQHPIDVTRGIQNRLNDAVADLTAAARAKRITLIRGSVTVLVAVAAGIAALNVPPQVAVALGVLGNIAINLTTSRIRYEPRIPREQLDDYTYLQRVHRAVQQIDGTQPDHVW